MLKKTKNKTSKHLLAIQLNGSDDYPPVIADRILFQDGLYYVSSYLISTDDYTVDFCDMYREDSPDNYVIEEYDAILIAGFARHFRGCKEVLSRIRDRAKGIPIICGGNHASFAPYEILQFADFAVIGSGEIPAQKLLDQIFNGVYPTPDNLPDNTAMMPDRQTLVFGRFVKHIPPMVTINKSLFRMPQNILWASINLTRGCPHNCNFCYGRRIHGNVLYKKDISLVEKELADISEATDTKSFYMTDLNFGCNKKYTRKVFEQIGNKGYRFHALARAELGDDPDFIRELNKGGLVGVYLGIESINDKTLKTYNKNINSEKHMERTLAFAENGVGPSVSFMFGADDQSLDDVVRSAKWAAKAKIVAPFFACYGDYPHQPKLYGTYQEIPDWRLMYDLPTFHHLTYATTFPKNIRPSKLQRSFIEGYKVFAEERFKDFGRHNIHDPMLRRGRLQNRYMEELVLPKMQKYADFLEDYEKPYYNRNDILLEDKLKAAYEQRVLKDPYHFENLTVKYL